MKERLVDLEVRYTHQQDVLDKLSDTVFEQQKLVDALNVRVKALEERVAQLLEERQPADQPPPHY